MSNQTTYRTRPHDPGHSPPATPGTTVSVPSASHTKGHIGDVNGIDEKRQIIGRAADLASTDHVAKFDDNDYCGPDFLDDAVRQIWLAWADIYTQPLCLIYPDGQQQTLYLNSRYSNAMRYVDADNFTGFFGSRGRGNKEPHTWDVEDDHFLNAGSVPLENRSLTEAMSILADGGARDGNS